METLILLGQIVGLSLLASLIIVGGIASGVFIGKLIVKEIF